MNAPLFDPLKLTAIRQRSSRRCEKLDSNDVGFLHDEAAKIIAQRLAVTNRVFNNPAILFSGPMSALIKDRIIFENDSINQNFLEIPFPEKSAYQQNTTHLSEDLQLQPGSIDLAISIFDLHWMNDLPGALSQISKALKPDGLLMAVVPTEGTLNELRQSIIAAELETRDGAATRVDPFPHIRQLGDLLQRASFKLPVIDVEEKTIRYSEFNTAIGDLRNIGAAHASAQDKPHLSATTWQRAKKIYSQNYSDDDGKLRASIFLGFISGWKEHESQQLPLKPGEAKNKFSDFL